MTNVFHKFQDVFHKILDAPDLESGEELVKYEQMMTADFIGTLFNIKNSDTRDIGDAVAETAMHGRHSRFVTELTEIKNAKTRAIGNKIIDSLLVLMYEYDAILVLIRNAPTRDAANKIIEDCLE